jgi:hypothetical protein
MLYREIIAVCSEIHTKHITTRGGPDVEFVTVKAGGIYSQGRNRGGGGGCRAAAPPPSPQNWNLKNTDFVDIISNV